MVLLFHNTQSALRAEEILLEAGLEVDVVPRPEGVPGGLCGIALDVSAARLAEVDRLLCADGVAYDLHVGGFGIEAQECAPVAAGEEDGLLPGPPG
ncbi:MAG TPA: DUF3343 domain-containing protein [Thermoleophilia bacterium]|nr:DUF3343 domain-containing protein [Thermoleophilia bacterium]